MKIHKHGFIISSATTATIQPSPTLLVCPTPGSNQRQRIVPLRYLMRHKHTSPFEMVMFQFHVKLPLSPVNGCATVPDDTTKVRPLRPVCPEEFPTRHNPLRPHREQTGSW